MVNNHPLNPIQDNGPSFQRKIKLFRSKLYVVELKVVNDNSVSFRQDSSGKE